MVWLVSQQPFTFLMQGGLDLVTPKIAAKPGTLLACQNYECAERGTRRVDGYERFDGRLKPSDATYYYAPFTAGNLSITQGAVVTGATSAATGIAVATATVLSGSYGGSNAVGYLGIYVTSGTFQNGEGLQTAAVTRVTLSAAPTLSGAPTDEIDATLLHAEMERRRALIQKPTGSGAVRGVWTYAGDVYAFRDGPGAVVCNMFMATTAGWSAITLNERITFNNGDVEEPVEGDTLERGAVSAVIERIVVRAGDWSTGDASGYIVLSGRTGGDFTAGAATLGVGATTLNLLASQITPAMQPGGRYRFRNHTFSGATTDTRMYGVYGLGAAFEWDGAVFTPIVSDLGVDAPTHIAVYANHLILGFERGALIGSEINWPLSFKAVNDAFEINFGSPVRGLIDGVSTSLMTYGKGRIGYLTGSDTDTFELRDVTTIAGAKAESPVMGPKPYHIDDRGIRRLDASQDFGDWKMGSVSELVAPIFETKAAAGVRPSAVVSVKRKNQIRWFFDDGSFVAVYLGRKFPEITTGTLPFIAYCACSGEDADGDEVIFAGAEDGYVYQIDTGTSFDGAEVDAWFVPHFASPNGNSSNKVWHGCAVECDAATTSTEGITYVAEYSYGDGLLVPSAEGTSSITGVGGIYDVSNWDTFPFDAPVQGTAWADLSGFGFNVSLAIRSELTYEDPHTISSMSFNYSQRGLIRGRHG
jgi:hypothetical protein